METEVGGGIGPTQDLVDEFELKDGTPAPPFSQKR